MTDPKLPSFLRYPQEAEIVARLLAGYGVLQAELGHCLGAALGDFETALRVVYRTRGEEARIQIASRLSGPRYEAAGVGQLYWEAIVDMRYCRQIRNQFLHCRWYETSNGLGFVDLKDTEKLKPVCIDAALLATQDAYFKYVQRCFGHLAERFWKRAGKSTGPDFPLPRKLVRPPLHNGPP